MSEIIYGLLSRASDLLRECGWDSKAQWFDERGKMLRNVRLGSEEYEVILNDIDTALAGMGSFSDLPLSPKSDRLTVQQARDQQWELVEAIGNVVDELRAR